MKHYQKFKFHQITEKLLTIDTCQDIVNIEIRIPSIYTQFCQQCKNGLL